MLIFDTITKKMSQVFSSATLGCDVNFFANDEIAFQDKGQKSILSYNVNSKSVKRIYTCDDIHSFHIQ